MQDTFFLHTRRGRQCVQDIQAHRRFGSRLHQPQGNFAAASRFASAFHRPAHGVRGKVGQTFDLVSHDGVEAQAIRRSSHNRPHGGSAAGLVAASKAAGAAVGERARCALFLGLSRQSVRPCRLGALHHGGGSKGAAAIGGFLVTRSSQVLRHVGHDHHWKTRFPTRLLACWCASYEGWRFLEAHKCATFPFWAFGTVLPGCSGAATAAKLVLATLLETVATRLPTYRLWNVVDDISGHVAGTPKMVQDLTAEAARLLVEGLQARDLPLSKGKFQVLIDGPDKPKHALLQQLEALGIDECDTARNVGADLQLGRRRRALVVKGRLARASKRTKRVRQLRKAGEHTGKLTLTGSNAGVLWGSEVLGFTPTQLQSIRDDAAKATYRLSRGQNATTTMLANAQAAGGKNIDPAFRHHRLVILAWATGVWEGTPDLDTIQAALRGSLARLSSGRGAEQRTQRLPSCSRSCVWAGARSQRGTLRPTTAPGSTSWPLRPKRWAFGWTRHPFCGLTALHIGISPRDRCSGKP